MRANSKQVVKTTVTTTTTKTTTAKPSSKPASKSSSQAPTKKVESQKLVASSDGDQIKEAFELFDANGDGRINAREIRSAMQSIGYDEKNPTVYEVITELDNPRNKNSGGATFNDFCQTVNYRVPEKETTEDLRRVFELFLDDPNSNTTSLESIKRVADELGENIEEIELNAMLNKASKSGARLTFDDFVAIMTGKQD
jgi:Ca2+-binding EF-hand superfamily protein